MKKKLVGCVATLMLALIVANASTSKTAVEDVVLVTPIVEEVTLSVVQTAEPTLTPTPEPVETPVVEEDPMDGLNRMDDVLVTHYCICEKCCGKTPDDPYYGITASGRPAEPGLSVAVDRSIIPLGSTVYVDYGDGIIRQYRADDVGGVVRGNHIDLCMVSHEAALNAGVQTATVWWEEN